MGDGDEFLVVGEDSVGIVGQGKRQMQTVSGAKRPVGADKRGESVVRIGNASAQAQK